MAAVRGAQLARARSSMRFNSSRSTWGRSQRRFGGGEDFKTSFQSQMQKFQPGYQRLMQDTYGKRGATVNKYVADLARQRRCYAFYADTADHKGVALGTAITGPQMSLLLKQFFAEN